jgi:ATP-dependent exoDNAse (exonuclease V) beta subunit
MDAIGSPSGQSKYDTITALLIIAKNCRTKTELVNRINRIFSGSNTGICLSTIHKAKGLESNNVHILCRSLMPSKSAKTKDEIQQENNLIYVAVTRARHKLCYVSETEFPPTKAFDGDGDALSEFRYIEAKICRLYGKEPVDYMSEGEMARFRLTSSSNTNIDSNPIHRNDNAKRLSSVQTTPFERKRKSLLDNL